MRYSLCFCLLLCFKLSFSQHANIPFEIDNNSSATYQEAINFYESLAKNYPKRCQLIPVGPTDSGHPLHVFIITDKRDKKPQTFFINNGIHPGEPCGIDASMLFAKELVLGSKKDLPLVDCQVAIVPAYNISGMLNRGSYSRANQNGPKAYGFRGNAQNLDLNRDFVKKDSKNARWLTVALRALSPDVFIDTHTTNGADYQYDLTVIPTQPEKLGPVLGPYMRDKFIPFLYQEVEKSGHPVSPYVFSTGVPQEVGIKAFIESPRYSSGYASLLHSLAFISEAHMLKPFPKRVKATKSFINAAFSFWINNLEEIKNLRLANQDSLFKSDVHLAWTIDSSRVDSLDFKGFKISRPISRVTQQEQLKYHRSQPETVKIPFYSYAKPILSIPAPVSYYIPQAYRDLVELPENIFVTDDWYETIAEDQQLAGQAYYIEDYETSKSPYEGHYLHSNVKVSKKPYKIQLRKGDLIVRINPKNVKHVMATLEPQAPDSYFAWGFFDSWLQQKEYFSSYVFDKTAEQMLDEDPTLKKAFEAEKANSEAFRNNAYQQLNWLYKRSKHYEQPFRYPIIRIEK